MPDLLLELFSEEIPARMQGRAASDLERAVCSGLQEAGLDFADARSFATPRRVTLAVSGLPSASPDIREERKGPRVGAPDKAVEGFLRAAGLASVKDATVQEDPKKGSFYVAVIERPGQPAADVVAAIVPEVVRKFPWPKSMRWGSGDLRWVRPLHGILCLLDAEPVDLEVDGVASGTSTWGHRFMAPKAIAVQGFADYLGKLNAAKVVLDPHARSQIILERARQLAEGEGLELIEDQSLIEENAGLAEWPVVLMGGFDEAFLDVPPEVLITAMKKHQKCFSLRDPKSRELANRFILVSNLEAEDGGTAIVAGNERVIRARLSDAKFFWDQDRKQSLETRLPRLNELIFHAKLGTVHDKAHAMAKLTMRLADHVPGADRRSCEQAAILAKADLVCEMVQEFPDLQGTMGRYYALQDGLGADVADAIAAHYAPQGPSDAVPASSTGVVVALCDKLYGLVGFFGIDERPTGSRDPYALRRAALGVIRIVLEHELRLRLLDWFDHTANVYRDIGEDVTQGWSDADSIGGELLAFFHDRLKVHLRDEGARHDLIDAVISPEADDLLMIVRRVEALGAFLDTDDGANLLAGVKRAQNILRIEEKKDKTSYVDSPDPKLYGQKEEKALAAAIDDAVAASAKAIKSEDFEAAMGAIARLRAPVDDFFDRVTVNDEDSKLRANRLRLLAQIRRATLEVADFSKIEG